MTTGTGTPIMLRLLPALMEGVDRYKNVINTESRPEAIRQILKDSLKWRGLLVKD